MSQQASFIALIVFVLLGISIWVMRALYNKKRSAAPTPAPADKPQEKPRPEGCCGQHAVCEKELLMAQQIKPEYFDDEELDAFIGHEGDYTAAETAQFEEVLYTMREEEVASWLTSLQQRGIRLPEALRDQAMMIVAENPHKPTL